MILIEQMTLIRGNWLIFPCALYNTTRPLQICLICALHEHLKRLVVHFSDS